MVYLNKNLFFTILLLVGFTSQAQDKMTTKTGVIDFEASVPTFEEVKAKNSGVSCLFNTRTGQIASLALVKGFRFKIALMEEHFNENYVKSEAHPKATFKGDLIDFNLNKVTTTGTKFIMKGSLSFNGKVKDITTTALVKRTISSLEITSNFELIPADFDIEIPSIVSKKIADKIKVSTFFELK